MKILRIPIQRLDYGQDLPLPTYATEGSSGVDLFAAIDQEITIDSGFRASIPLGIAIAIPNGYEGQIRPRSGLAVRSGVTILNSPGTIDSDFRGEIRVVLINFGNDSFIVTRGDRIAQLIVSPVIRVKWQETKQLMTTKRGAKGFCSTGTGV